MKKAIMIISSQGRLQHNYFQARILFERWIELPSVPEDLQLKEDPYIDLDSDTALRKVSPDEES